MADFKTYSEQREEALNAMETLTETAKTEQRAFTEEETAKFAEYEKAINNIDATVNAIERARELKPAQEEKKMDENKTPTVEELETREFAQILRTQQRAADMTKANNGSVIPTTIVNRIIDKVKDISPLFREAEHFDIKGNISIPYVDSSNDTIAAAYATEFTDLNATGSKLLTIDLTGYLAGVMVKISKAILNNSDLDLVNYAINKISRKVAEFLDTEILNGTTGKITGVTTATEKVSAASATAITVDELIATQDLVKGAYQDGCIWVMAPATWTAVKKVLAGTANYELNSSIENGFAGRLLGKPVYTSDACEALATGKRSVWYVNPHEALALKMVDGSIQVLNELYAAQYAIGVVSFFEVDCKVQNQQAIGYLQQA